MSPTAKIPQTTFSYDGARLNVYYVNKGEGLPKHDHVYDHATLCTAGSCIVRKEDKELIINKMSKPLNLRHSEWHEIEALEDNTVFINVFAEDKSG